MLSEADIDKAAGVSETPETWAIKPQLEMRQACHLQTNGRSIGDGATASVAATWSLYEL